MNNLNKILQLADQYEQELPAFPQNGTVNTPVNALIDHTLLKPEATPAQVEQLCQEAVQYQFAAVVTNSRFIPLLSKSLRGSTVAVCAVVGFPLGAMATALKVAETNFCTTEGAVEIDTVVPVGMLRAGEWNAVLDDIQAVVEASHQAGALVKVILETSLLTRKEKILACLISQAARADFVKTSTGFSGGGATVDDIELMRRVVGSVDRMGVKASGGVRNLADARAMIAAGANRLGTSSGVKIIQEALSEEREP